LAHPPLSRTLTRAPRPRSAAPAAVVIAAALALALGAPAWAAAASTTPPAAAETSIAATDQTVTWSVRPADSTGADGRSWIELTVDPGTVVEEHMAVRNLGTQPAMFALTAADGYFTDKGRFNMLPASSPSVAAGTWISLPDTVTVAPGETAIVAFTVDVPADATPGDHAAGVAASVLSAGSAGDGSAVSVESRVGFRVMTRVTGTLRPEVAATGVDARYRTSWNPFEPGELTIDVAAANVGNVGFRLTHDTDAAGRIEPSETEELDMLPGDARTVTVEVDDVWPLLFTRGTVTLTPEVAERDDAPLEAVRPVRAEYFAWTIPWPQLAVAGALALIAVAIFGARRRERTRIDGLVAAAAAQGRAEALAEQRADDRARSLP
jgi:hypothetical protein